MPILEFTISLILTFIAIIYGCNDADSWIHKTYLDGDGERVFMQWKPENETIRIKVTGKTKGWLGIGFSPNGDMVGSDIALAWVKNGKGYLQDRHAYENHQPPIDNLQNLELLSAYENETHTSFCFKRNLITCDEEDYPITQDTMKIIWAMNPEDPSDSENASSAKYHGPKDRGYLNQAMLSMLNPKPSLSKDIKTWKVQFNNFTIPNNETTVYWCQFIKPPQLTKKHQVIGFIPLIQKENLRRIHHFGLFECHGKNINQQIESIPNWDEGFSCLSPKAPVAALSCKKFFIELTAGGKEEFYPPNVGFPFNTDIYYMFNIHYTNPSRLPNLHDSSSLLIYYTSKLRQNDAAILILGDVIHQPYQLIPPRQDKWVSVAHCASECLQKAFPTNKFKVFGGLVHGHKTTYKIVARHFRGNKELPPIMENDHHDYKYQQNLFFKEVEVYTTDIISTECHIRTPNRTNMTLGGPTVEDEMCLFFMYYYPKVNLTSCYSHLSLSDIEQVTEVKDVWPQKSEVEGPIIKEPPNLRNITLRDYLKKLQLNQTQINRLQQMEFNSDKIPVCEKDDINIKQEATSVNYPKNIIPYVKQDPCINKTRD